MIKTLRAVFLGVVCLSAISDAACGGHATSPTAPSSAASAPASPSPSSAPAPVVQGATIKGTVAAAIPAGIVVAVAGGNASSIADAAGRFNLTDVQPSDVVLTFSAPGVSASTPVGAVAAADVVEVAVTVSGNVATIDAQQRIAPDNSIAASGTLSDLDVAGRQFRLGSIVVQVASSALIKRGDASVELGDLKNGDRVYVRGMKEGAAVRASEVLATAVTPPPPPPPPAPPPAAEEVTLNGVVAGLAGGCPGVGMTVAGSAVRTSAATVFSNRACADLRNGDTVNAIGTKQSDGSVLASKVYYVSSPATEVTLTGTVANLAGSCPVVTMTVQGTAVKGSSATTWDGTKGCSLLANGDSVTVVGVKQSDGSVVASKVTNATAPPAQDVYVSGPIVGLTGACPAVSMTLSGTLVKTNAATTFNGRACAELRNGDVIYAAGPKQSDGSILANRTFYTAPTVTLSGTVSNFGGAWPVLTFTVQGKAVKTSSATTCDGTKGCSQMANGDSVTVVGTEQSDGSVLASKVTNATAPPAQDVYVNGPIVGLTGACPAVSMTLSGTLVKTNAATTFNGRACAELRNGDVIYAAGPKQSDGSILANRTFYTAPTVTLSGTVSNFGGAWPVLTFTVQGKAVKTSSATTCDGTKGCSQMANGDSVTVVGTEQSDGSVLASKVTNATAPPPAETTVSGVLAGLGGSCPALTMTVAGTGVKTNSATVFNSKTCGELKNGDTVYAAGPKQSDGTVLATRIYYVTK